MCNLFNHRLNRLSIMRSRTARVLKPLFRTLVNCPLEIFPIAWQTYTLQAFARLSVTVLILDRLQVPLNYI